MSLRVTMRHRWLLLGWIACALALLGCERRVAPSSGAAGLDEAAPRHVSYDARFEMRQGAHRRAAVAAGQMAQYDRGDSTFVVMRRPPERPAARVTAWWFTPEGDSSATLTADSLIYYDRREQFEAFGAVQVVTQDRKRLWSDYLQWDEADRTIRTDRFVRIITPSERVEGYGLVADENLDTYQIGRFTAQVTLDDSEAPPDTTQP